MGNDQHLKQTIIKVDSKYKSSIYNNKKSSYLGFKSYMEYFSEMNAFTYLFQSLIMEIGLTSNLTLFEAQILNNSIAFLSLITTEDLFDVAMTIYHRIGSIYGSSISYNRNELSKITFSLISKYLAVQNPLQDGLMSTITDNIIKRINYFTDEFPFRLKSIMNLIQEKCIFAFKYDKIRNMNIYIEPFVLGYNKPFTYMDYVVYIIFLIENVIPSLKLRCYFNERINIIINFNQDEVNTEMISYILHWINMFYPLVINKFFIVNFDEETLFKNVAFKNELEDSDYFQRVKIIPNDYLIVLTRDIEEQNIPISYGGKGEINGIDSTTLIQSHEKLCEYFIKLIFKEEHYMILLEKLEKNSKEDN